MVRINLTPGRRSGTRRPAGFLPTVPRPDSRPRRPCSSASSGSWSCSSRSSSISVSGADQRGARRDRGSPGRFGAVPHADRARPRHGGSAVPARRAWMSSEEVIDGRLFWFDSSRPSRSSSPSTRGSKPSIRRTSPGGDPDRGSHVLESGHHGVHAGPEASPELRAVRLVGVTVPCARTSRSRRSRFSPFSRTSIRW